MAEGGIKKTKTFLVQFWKTNWRQTAGSGIREKDLRQRCLSQTSEHHHLNSTNNEDRAADLGLREP